jgi:NADH:ubiquinone oxidoreductase subunit C
LTRVAARTGDFLGEKLLGKEEKSGYFQFSVRAPDYKPLFRFLEEDAVVGFTFFLVLCGADYLKYPHSLPERCGVLATLLSPGLGVKAQVRAFLVVFMWVLTLRARGAAC